MPHWSCLVAVLALIALTIACVDDAEAQPRGFNYDESKVPKYTLPDPLVMPGGKRVPDAATWWKSQRPIVLKQMEMHVYGAMPPALPIAHVEEHGLDENALGGKGRRKEVTLYFKKDRTGPAVNVLILLPPKSSKAKGPYPAFLGYNFTGNHTVHADPKIRMSKVWPRKAGSQPSVPAESTRGRSASRWQVEKILSRGYALVTIYYGDVDPDFNDGFKNGVHALHPKYQNRADNWTSIGGWAWTLSRVLDYLETDDLIDAKRVAVIGHSRLGKTSLWAGAADPRFALVISNNSGCGGAALARRRFGETVKRINTSFPHWFTKLHKQYNDNEDKMPVDQHYVMALIAPRPLYVASAERDSWADPKGEFLATVAATPVYKLLGKQGMPATEWPAVGKPVHGTIGYHVRVGKHDVTAFDWEQYLDFADKHLGGK